MDLIMDEIKALIDHPITSGGRDELHIFINGERLDLFLSAESGLDFRGLSSARLVFAGSGPDVGEGRPFITERSRLDEGGQILPILIESNDSASYGLAIVADVRLEGDEVQWLRFGLSSAEPLTVAGEKIEWLDTPGPLYFDRRQYLDCLATFKLWQPAAATPDLKSGLRRPLFFKLYSFICALSMISNGYVNLPALAFLQIQYGLAESPDQPEWSFVHLLPTSGLLAFGLDQGEDYLLAISQNGRDLFSLNDGRRKARAAGKKISGQGESATAEGIGPLAADLMPVWGRLGRKTPPGLLRAAKLVSNGLSDIVGVLSVDEDRLMIVGQEDGIYVFKHI